MMKNYCIYDVRLALWFGGLIASNLFNLIFVLYVILTEPSLAIAISGSFTILLAFIHAMLIEELL